MVGLANDAAQSRLRRNIAPRERVILITNRCRMNRLVDKSGCAIVRDRFLSFDVVPNCIDIRPYVVLLLPYDHDCASYDLDYANTIHRLDLTTSGCFALVELMVCNQPKNHRVQILLRWLVEFRDESEDELR